MKKVIIVSCFDWYDKRLKYIVSAFNKQGFETIILSSDFDHLVKKKKEFRNPCIEYIDVPEYKRNLSIKRIYSHYFFAKKIYKRLLIEKPTLVYCLIPPNFLAKYCIKYKRKNGSAKVIFDIIDLWPESFPIQKYDNLFIFKIWKNLRQKNIKDSNFIVCECEYYREYLKIDEKRSSVLYLTKSDRGAITQFKPNDDIFLGYLGSLNHLIDIDMMCNIVKKISIYKKVHVIIIGKGENEVEICDRLKKAGAIVIFYGAIYSITQIKEIFSNCNFAFNVYKSHLHIGITIKSIDYFQLGMPIINNIKFDTGRFIENYYAGININDSNIEMQIKKIVNLTEEELSKMREGSRKIFIDYFHDEKIENSINSMLMKMNEQI